MKDLILLILLSFSWILIYLLVKYLKKFFIFILIDLPIYLSIKNWRRKKGIIKIRENLKKENEVTDISSIPEKVKLVDKKMGEIEKDPFKYYIGNGIIYRFLIKSLLSEKFAKFHIYEINKIYSNLFDLDYSILKAFSNDKNLVESGCLNIKYYPFINQNEKKVLLNKLVKTIDDENLKKTIEYSN